MPFPDQHNCTTPVPSRTFIAVMSVLTALAGGGTAWIITGPVFDGRHLVGFLVGLVTTVVLFAQTVSRMMLRRDARRRMLAETGTWTHPEKGRVTVTLWEWSGSWDKLAEILTRMEEGGYVPADDEPTRSIRARLMLPGRDNFERPS